MKFCKPLSPGSWMAIGIAVGAGLGAAMHDMAMGVGIGAGMGSLLMAISASRKSSENDKR